MNKEKHSEPLQKLKPIKLYDHLPGILAGYPAVLFLLLSILMFPNDRNVSWWPEAINGHMLFWIGLSIMIVWYVAFQFNLPKNRFWLAFGLLGTFIGIPVVLEIAGIISPFATAASWLEGLSPEINSSAWFILSVVFGGIWLGNFIWSRTHMRVTIDESGLTLNRMGGKGERFDLIGLKTENEPIDYLELFIGGIGSMSLKTRMNKPIFTMRRVFGLYRIPIFPFYRGKLSRIEEMLTYQGKVVAVDPKERADIADALDGEGEGEIDMSQSEEGDGDENEFDAPDRDEKPTSGTEEFS